MIDHTLLMGYGFFMAKKAAHKTDNDGAFKYACFPTKEQASVLEELMESNRIFYNLCVLASDGFQRFKTINQDVPDEHLKDLDGNPIMRKDGTPLMGKPYKEDSFTVVERDGKKYRKFNPESYLLKKGINVNWYGIMLYACCGNSGKNPFVQNFKDGATDEEINERNSFIQAFIDREIIFRESKGYKPFSYYYNLNGMVLSCVADKVQKAWDRVFANGFGSPVIKKFGEPGSFTLLQLNAKPHSEEAKKYTGTFCPDGTPSKAGLYIISEGTEKNKMGAVSMPGMVFYKGIDGKRLFEKGIPFMQHRPMRCHLNSITFSKSGTGKYFIAFSVNHPNPLPKLFDFQEGEFKLSDFSGYDWGRKFNDNTNKHGKRLRNIANTVLGRTITVEDTLPIMDEIDKLKSKRDLTNDVVYRKKLDFLIRKQNEKLVNKRKHDINYAARAVIKDSQQRHIALEDISGKEMTESNATRKANKKNKKKLKSNGNQATENRANLSVTPFMFRSAVEQQARKVGKCVILVDPKNTSQFCPCCGKQAENFVDLSVRECTCTFCQTTYQRDQGAAIEITKRGYTKAKAFKEGVGTLKKETKKQKRNKV